MSGEQTGWRRALGAVAQTLRDRREAERKEEEARKLVEAVAPRSVGPTPEQMARYAYEENPDVVRGQVTAGTVYKRLPHFETLASGGSDISAEALRCLRWYRNAYEEQNMSETRCALDVQGRGRSSSHGALLPMEAAAFRGHEFQSVQKDLGAFRAIVNGVALFDRTYSDLAMERYGSRNVDYIVKGKTVNRPAPKSGRHREIIRQEFVTGLKMLTAAVKPHIEAQR